MDSKYLFDLRGILTGLPDSKVDSFIQYSNSVALLFYIIATFLSRERFILLKSVFLFFLKRFFIICLANLIIFLSFLFNCYLYVH
jgi:hypothetical protein